jgi:hypothetical protein
MKPKSVLIAINRLLPFIPSEGSVSKEQVQFFHQLLQRNRGIQWIAETGFNTGVSSRAVLAARADTLVVSFDIGQNQSVPRAKADIDRDFPGRHELVLGDSTETLPAYAQKHPEKRFDLVFIDGGHDYDVVKADLLNFRAMSHDQTIVIMDDLTPWWRWGRGPTQVWQEALKMGLISPEGLYKNGEPVTEPAGRGLEYIWGVAHYRNDNGVIQ